MLCRDPRHTRTEVALCCLSRLSLPREQGPEAESRWTRSLQCRRLAAGGGSEWAQRPRQLWLKSEVGESNLQSQLQRATMVTFYISQNTL